MRGKGRGLAAKLPMKPDMAGVLGLVTIGVLAIIALGCSIEEAELTPTKAPAPIPILTARQQEAIDHLTGRESLATPIPTPTATTIPTRTPARLPPPTRTARQQEALDYATGRKYIGTPTPVPTPTATPVPTPTPAATPTATPVPSTVGERQLDWFKWQCETHGVAAWAPLEHGNIHYYGGVSGKYLLDHYSDHPNASIGKLTFAGSRWETRWLGVPLESDGAYSEGGTCILISTGSPHSTWWATDWEPDYTTTIRLLPLDEVSLSEEELTFSEGYHFLSKETGYTGRFDVRMWWSGSADVPQEERNGKVILFNFWSKGPGRREMNSHPTD